jgi:hypothetical protein
MRQAWKQRRWSGWFLPLLSKIQRGAAQILRQDIWSTDLVREDMVYAFLSTEPMPALYRQGETEMKPGSLLVSNSFPAPDVEPDEVWELPDRRKTQIVSL